MNLDSISSSCPPRQVHSAGRGGVSPIQLTVLNRWAVGGTTKDLDMLFYRGSSISYSRSFTRGKLYSSSFRMTIKEYMQKLVAFTTYNSCKSNPDNGKAAIDIEE